MVYIKHNHFQSSEPCKPYADRRNRFLYAGRLTESKGIGELLAAWRLIGMKMKEAPELTICGAGELSDYIDRYIAENRIKNVSSLGELPAKEVYALMDDSKALIYPTRWFEGEPMAIIEAYDRGTPVIATDIGGVSEMIADGITGRKLSYDDMVRDIADIVTGWDDGFRYDADAIRGFASAFSRDNSIKAINAILETCKIRI